jgi:hypothetical protein
MEVAEEGIQISRRRRAVIDLIGMFVHIQHQNRHGGAGRVQLIPLPVVLQQSGMQVQAQRDPGP